MTHCVTQEQYDRLYDEYALERRRVEELKSVLMELRSYTASYIRDNYSLRSKISEALSD
jgi:hypothetical protein